MYDSVCDPSNPFNTQGISTEDRFLIMYLIDAKRETGLDAVVTCTTDHPTGATRHLQPGTNGQGLAIDCRLRTRGNDIHRKVFDAFRPVESQLYELIYADAPYNIKAGKRVKPYAVSGHHDHVHVAVTKGTYLKFPSAPLKDDPMTPKQESEIKAELLAIKNYVVDAQIKLVDHDNDIQDCKNYLIAILEKLG